MSIPLSKEFYTTVSNVIQRAEKEQHGSMTSRSSVDVLKSYASQSELKLLIRELEDAIIFFTRLGVEDAHMLESAKSCQHIQSELASCVKKS